MKKTDKELTEAIKKALDPTAPLEEYRQRIFGNYPTIREQFAMASLTAAAMLNTKVNEGVDRLAYAEANPMQDIIQIAFNMADEMLAKREEKTNEPA